MAQAWVYGAFNQGKNLGMLCYCDLTYSGCTVCPNDPAKCKHYTIHQAPWGYELDLAPLLYTAQEVHCQVSSAILIDKILESGTMEEWQNDSVSQVQLPLFVPGSHNFSISIRITHDDTMCKTCSNGSTLPAKYGMLVDLYTNTSGTNSIGTMMYAHIEQTTRLAPGLYTRSHPNFNNGGWIIGYPKDLCTACSPECTCRCCATCAPCAVGTHVHMQSKGAEAWTQYICGATIERGHQVWRFDH